MTLRIAPSTSAPTASSSLTSQSMTMVGALAQRTPSVAFTSWFRKCAWILASTRLSVSRAPNLSSGGRGSVGHARGSQGRLRSVSDRPARRRTALLPASSMLRRSAHAGEALGEDGSRTAKPCGPGTRCWCQVGGGFGQPDRARQDLQSADDGDKTNSSPGRARYKPLKPAACGNAGCFRWTRGDYRVHFSLHAGCGCIGRPAFPTPSTGERLMYTSGALCVAGWR